MASACHSGKPVSRTSCPKMAEKPQIAVILANKLVRNLNVLISEIINYMKLASVASGLLKFQISEVWNFFRSALFLWQ